MKGHNTFTMAVIKELYQLFLQKDNADPNKQKYIRNKMREIGFYITDFTKKGMNSTDFIRLCKNGTIKITDKDKFLKENPEIAKKIEYVESVQNEGLNLVGLLSIKDIDLNSLKHREVWEKLGLNEELCSKINYVGTSTISVDGIVNSNISDLYNAVKTTIVGEFMDC